jgi:hypothetical protein
MQQAKIKTELLRILKKQEKKVHHIAINLILVNGNIKLNSFRLFDFDISTGILKGMTMYEEYAYLRENRKPIFAYFNISEISTIETAESNYLFLNQSMHEESIF